MYSVEIVLNNRKGSFIGYNDDCVEVITGYCEIHSPNHRIEKIKNRVLNLKKKEDEYFLVKENSNKPVFSFYVGLDYMKNLCLFENEDGSMSFKYKQKLIKFLGGGNLEFFIKTGTF